MLLFGFGFNFLMLFVIMPSTIVLTLLWAITRKMIFGKLLGLMWGGLLALLLLGTLLHNLNRKMKVTKSKIYGKYVIDRSKFSGEQAEWQYDNFKFRITEKNQMLFSYKGADKEFKTDTIKVSILERYYSHRLEIGKDSTRHHIIQDNPTLYRDIWNFNYVFKSDKFGNVFFKKKRLIF